MKLLITLIAAMQLTSCIHKALDKVIPQRDYQGEQVTKVQSAAIVAYDVLYFQPTGVGSQVVGRLSTAQMVSNTRPVENELAAETYGYLADQLNAKKIKTLSLENLLRNQSYQAFMKTHKPSVQEKTAANHFQKPYIINGVMRPTNPDYLLTTEQIKKLGEDLKVDTIVMARLYYTTQKTDYLGLGIANAYLRSDFVFHMFDTKTGKQIWFDRGFLGSASDESLGKVSGMENVETIAKLSKPLAQKTIADFMKR